MADREAWTPTASVGEVVNAVDIHSIPGGWLGYNQVTANQTGISSETALTGLTVTVDVGADRRIKITAHGRFTRTAADGVTQLRIKESTTIFQEVNIRNSTTAGETEQGIAVITPSEGLHTYHLTLTLVTGTGTVGLAASATVPAFILVEDIGPAS